MRFFHPAIYVGFIPVAIAAALASCSQSLDSPEALSGTLSGTTPSNGSNGNHIQPASLATPESKTERALPMGQSSTRPVEDLAGNAENRNANNQKVPARTDPLTQPFHQNLGRPAPLPWANLEGDAQKNLAASLRTPLRLEEFVASPDAGEAQFAARHNGRDLIEVHTMANELQAAISSVGNQQSPAPSVGGAPIDATMLVALENEKQWLWQEWNRQTAELTMLNGYATPEALWPARYLHLDRHKIAAERSRVQVLIQEEQRRTGRMRIFS